MTMWRLKSTVLESFKKVAGLDPSALAKELKTAKSTVYGWKNGLGSTKMRLVITDLAALRNIQIPYFSFLDAGTLGQLEELDDKWIWSMISSGNPRALTREMERESEEIARLLQEDSHFIAFTESQFYTEWNGHACADTAELNGVNRQSKPPTYWNVPPIQSAFFTGREDVLSAIANGFRSANIQFLRGLGGAGKTQVAAQYASQYMDRYEAVFWMNAEDTGTIGESCVAASRLLGLCNSNESHAVAKRLLIDWLQTKSGWLLIFDNADSIGSDYLQTLKSCFPNPCSGHILITSRLNRFDHFGVAKPIHLRELSIEQSVAFLHKRSGRASSQELSGPETTAATELADRVDGLPLALEQAGAYLCAIPISFEHYFREFEKNQVDILEAQKPVAGDYSSTVATTWVMNFQEVERRSLAAADLLRISSLATPPDNIAFELIIEGACEMGAILGGELSASTNPKLALANCLAELERFSLVWVDAVKETYSMHRLVQLVLRTHEFGLNDDANMA